MMIEIIVLGIYRDKLTVLLKLISFILLYFLKWLTENFECHVTLFSLNMVVPEHNESNFAILTEFKISENSGYVNF